MTKPIPPQSLHDAEASPRAAAHALSGDGNEAIAFDLPRFVRVDADLRLQVGQGPDGAPRLSERREQGAFRFRMPRIAGRREPGRALEVLTVNVAGGLAGGDQLRLAITAEDGAHLALSSATAERIYRSASSTTDIQIALDACSGARLAWLPQETILHDGARLSRRVDIHVDRTSHLLFAEITYLGRAASGEGFTAGALHESWRLRHGGQLIFAEEMRFAPGGETSVARAGILDGATAIATVLLVGADSEARLEPLRDVITRHRDIEAGATARPGLVFARLIGKDGAALRCATLAMIGSAAAGFPLPRLIAQDIDDACKSADVQERPAP